MMSAVMWCSACEAPCGFSGMKDSRPVTLVKQLDCAYDDQRTSSSMINAVVGGIDPAGMNTYILLLSWKTSFIW